MDKVLSVMIRPSAWHVSRHPAIKTNSIASLDSIKVTHNEGSQYMKVMVKNTNWDPNVDPFKVAATYEYSPAGFAWLSEHKPELVKAINERLNTRHRPSLDDLLGVIATKMDAYYDKYQETLSDGAGESDEEGEDE